MGKKIELEITHFIINAILQHSITPVLQVRH